MDNVSRSMYGRPCGARAAMQGDPKGARPGPAPDCTRWHRLPMTVRAIVFDLWGTLMADRRELFPERARLRFEGIEPVLRRLRIEADRDTFTRTHLQSNRAIGRMQDAGRDVSAEARARHVIYQFAPSLADQLTPADCAEIVEAYSGVALRLPPILLPGAREALERARHLGLGVGLISNTGVVAGRHLRQVFESEGILDAFDSLVFSDEHGRSKPHRAIYDRALEELGVPADEAVYAGDTPRYDVGPPRRYGWWVVQVGDRDDGDPPAHRRVPGVLDVYPALEEMGLLEGRASRSSAG
ncbi:MAG: HAD-IA family hydrolase [Dehalococcoidia bacterium]|nr:HAD-IA family hydrolase [Dehalococcoidia bacterium]